ncbi:MAG TPA: TolC family protein, partial [Candidatus Binataceae bacterium]|nr:TolC family protein [Candidatus Binataceae bacterium]
MLVRLGYNIIPFVLSVFVCLLGCADLASRPELHPDEWAPSSRHSEWKAPAAIETQLSTPEITVAAEGHPARTQSTQEYDLPSLIDIALINSPETLRTWSSARSAAASFGAAQAPYYPQATFSSDNGYLRTIIELPRNFGELKQWQADPLVTLNWTLLDFGRRESASAIALNRLLSANLALNRSIQDVVFNTESAFYALDAADAAVSAAEQNLKLAQTDFRAVRQRVNLGLATEPQLLLAKETVAQSQFDLANARLTVRDAQAQIAVALGVSADPPVKIVRLENQVLPQKF